MRDFRFHGFLTVCGSGPSLQLGFGRRDASTLLLRTAAGSQTSRSNVRPFPTVQVIRKAPERTSLLRLTFQAQSRSGIGSSSFTHRREAPLFLEMGGQVQSHLQDESNTWWTILDNPGRTTGSHLVRVVCRHLEITLAVSAVLDHESPCRHCYGAGVVPAATKLSSATSSGSSRSPARPLRRIEPHQTFEY